MSDFSNLSLNLDELVRQVMNDLRQKSMPEDTGSNTSSNTGSNTGSNISSYTSLKALGTKPSSTEESISVPVLSATNPSSVARPSTLVAVPAKPVEIFLTEKLVTQALIVAKDDGTIRQWRASRGTVLTPMARDELRKRGITLVLGEGLDNQESLLQKAAPQKIASSMREQRASSFVASSSSQTTSQSLTRSFVIGLHDIEGEPTILPLLERLGKSVSLTIFRKKCIKETARTFQQQMALDSATGGIMLTHYPALGAMLANRQGAQIRALVGVTPDQVRQEAAFMGANLLVLDPKGVGFYRIQQMISFFIEKGPFELPKFLRESAQCE